MLAFKQRVPGSSPGRLTTDSKGVRSTGEIRRAVLREVLFRPLRVCACSSGPPGCRSGLAAWPPTRRKVWNRQVAPGGCILATSRDAKMEISVQMS